MPDSCRGATVLICWIVILPALALVGCAETDNSSQQTTDVEVDGDVESQADLDMGHVFEEIVEDSTAFDSRDGDKPDESLPCDDSFCSWHGSCSGSNGVNSCTCDDGYTGNHCEQCVPGSIWPCSCGYGLPDAERVCEADGAFGLCACPDPAPYYDELCQVPTRGAPADLNLEPFDGPMIIEGSVEDADESVVIEGYEFTNPDGPCLQIRNIENVVIRNNVFRHCGAETSAAAQRMITEGYGDDVTPDDFFVEAQTGAIRILDADTVQIVRNTVDNNDYGIVVSSTNLNVRSTSVDISHNVVTNNHRHSAIKVDSADRLTIDDNCVMDNGLSVFFSNDPTEGASGLWYSVANGIHVEGSRDVAITGNLVVNASGDGISFHINIVDSIPIEQCLSTDVEIADNIILRNNEQGIWAVGVDRCQIHDNIIHENRSRPEEMGGSSGITFNPRVTNCEIFDNDIAYNDVTGLSFCIGTDVDVHHNDIHHNGDGAISWFHYEFDDPREDPRIIGADAGFSADVYSNHIHDNRIMMFQVWTEADGLVTVEDNTIEQNGGAPVHYENYVDHNVVAHPEDWEYHESSVLLDRDNDAVLNAFQFGDNDIDGVRVSGLPD